MIEEDTNPEDKVQKEFKNKLINQQDQLNDIQVEQNDQQDELDEILTQYERQQEQLDSLEANQQKFFEEQQAQSDEIIEIIKRVFTSGQKWTPIKYKSYSNILYI